MLLTVFSNQQDAGCSACWIASFMTWTAHKEKVGQKTYDNENYTTLSWERLHNYVSLQYFP